MSKSRKPLAQCSYCDKPAYALGLCKAHHWRNWKHGHPLGGKQVNWQGDECLAPRCHRKPYAHNLCRTHYHRWYRTGDPELDKLIRKYERSNEKPRETT